MQLILRLPLVNGADGISGMHYKHPDSLSKPDHPLCTHKDHLGHSIITALSVNINVQPHPPSFQARDRKLLLSQAIFIFWIISPVTQLRMETTSVTC